MKLTTNKVLVILFLLIILIIPLGFCQVIYPKQGEILGPGSPSFIPNETLKKIIVKKGSYEECGQCHADVAKNFTSSLHYTLAGVKEEFKKGAGEEFGIEIPKGCTKCHADCYTCHGNFTTAHTQKVPMEICVECHHGRVGVNYVGYLGGMKAKGPSPDVHFEKGLECADCHTFEEIHGNGVHYTNEKLAVKIRCEDCHLAGKVVKNMTATYDPNTVAHRIHDGKLACYACHAGWYQTCYNCHLDVLIKEKKKKVDKSYVDKFWLIKGYDGRIKPAYLMVTSYEDKMHVGWVEYCPHTITKAAKNCSFCHEKAEILYPQSFQKGEVLGPSKASFLPAEKTILGVSVDLIGYGLLASVVVGLAIHIARRVVGGKTSGGKR